MKTQVITAHVPKPLAQKVDDLSQKLERSKAWIVKQALIAWIEQEEAYRQLTLEALEDVDEGNTIEHQSVQHWVNNLDGD